MRFGRTLKLLLLLSVVAFAWPVHALDFGTNVTIYDEDGYQALGQGGEDKETEPGMVLDQVWDLEGFFLDGTALTMVGGYNFQAGQGGWYSGDIFIDVDGDAVFGDITGTDGNGNKVVTKTFGYDYVLDLDFSSLTYSVFALTEGTSRTVTTYYDQNEGSNPWRYYDGGELVTGADGSIGFLSGLSDADTGFTGGTHYAASVDLGFLSAAELANLTLHFTMGCGNDNLMGETNPVPEPGTMLLTGIGLIGMAALGRRRSRR